MKLNKQNVKQAKAKKTKPKYGYVGSFPYPSERKSYLTKNEVVDLLNYNPFTHNNNDWF